VFILAIIDLIHECRGFHLQVRGNTCPMGPFYCMAMVCSISFSFYLVLDLTEGNYLKRQSSFLVSTIDFCHECAEFYSRVHKNAGLRGPF